MQSTDHPAVSYGPPITLSWDYLEYDPLDIDEYEIHHPKRRNLRQMGLNYYQRRSLLLRMTDYTPLRFPSDLSRAPARAPCERSRKR